MSPAIARTRVGDLIGLVAFVALYLGISAIGGWITAESVGTWYRTLQKPVFNPPDWVFAPVWTALYLMIAGAGWRVWRSHGMAGVRFAMAAYAVQLALNLAWSFLFFGGRMDARPLRPVGRVRGRAQPCPVAPQPRPGQAAPSNRRYG